MDIPLDTSEALSISTLSRILFRYNLIESWLSYWFFPSIQNHKSCSRRFCVWLGWHHVLAFSRCTIQLSKHSRCYSWHRHIVIIPINCPKMQITKHGSSIHHLRFVVVSRPGIEPWPTAHNASTVPLRQDIRFVISDIQIRIFLLQYLSSKVPFSTKAFYFLKGLANLF